MKITAEKMAEIYINRAHRRSKEMVYAIMTEFKDSRSTYSYWNRVYQCLQVRFPE